MPPVPSLIISSVIFLLMHFVIGGAAFMFWPGFMLGYLMYGTMHYAIHAWNPPFRWMKPLWRNHHLHHYKDDHKGFGVSSTICSVATPRDTSRSKRAVSSVVLPVPAPPSTSSEGVSSASA